MIKGYCLEGWPAYPPQQTLLKPYWENRGHLTVVKDLLLYNERIVVPTALRLKVLDQIHEGHLGITKCRARARESVWWPRINSVIQEMISRCQTCAKVRPEQREHLLTSEWPSHPWERVGTDLFEYEKKTYLLAVDYYSRWVEVRPLQNTQAKDVVEALKSIFATHGVPEIVVSDNGPQYASECFQNFTKSYGFTHSTSSPLYPQSNGEAERAVRTMKNILKKNQDPYLGLLAYRSTPLQNRLSPSQLLMGRRLLTTLPMLPSNLTAEVDTKQLDMAKEKEKDYRNRQSINYDRRHRVVTLPTLEAGDRVWIRDQDRHGTVVERSSQPRSYLVRTSLGTTVRRNRRSLVYSGEPQSAPNSHVQSQTITSPQALQKDSDPEKISPKLIPSHKVPPTLNEKPTGSFKFTHSGRVVKPAERLDM